jgi:spermidine synthase
MSAFPYGLRMINFVAVSDSPFSLDKVRWRSLLEHYTIDGHPCIDTSSDAGKQLLDDLTAMPDTMRLAPVQGWGMESRESILARTKAATIITDDNMVSEFRQPLRFPTPD